MRLDQPKARRRTTVHACLVLGLVLLAGGCGPRRDRGRAEPYRGPTLSLSEFVAQANSESSRLPTLWMRHDFKARIVDENGKSTAVSGDGAILYAAPGNMLMTASKAGAGALFELGTNAERYWMSVPFDEVNTMWWGRHEYVDAPCAEPIPIRPDLVAQVLGVSPMDASLTRLPAPTLKFDAEADCYVLAWVLRAPDRYIIVKESWYDRTSLLPQRIRLFDDNGRVMLEARLSRHEPVEVPDVPREQWPRVARLFELTFPQTGSWMNLSIDEAMLRYRNVPTEGTFRFPSRPAVSRIVQLDEPCGP